MRISIAVPTGEEGVYSPVPFAGPEEIIGVAQLAERLGFYAVWGLDFITPGPSMGIKEGEEPNWYEVLMSLASVASVTKRIRLGTGVLVLPQREPILLAKQVATLDHFSKGRAVLGVGVGSHRDEFEAMLPRLKKADRSAMMKEQLEALNLLLSQKEASFNGKYVEFDQVSLNPKPVQQPFPIYLAGNHPETASRVARWCSGWIMSVSTSLEGIPQRIENLKRHLAEQGRDISEVDLTAVSVLSIDRSHETAVERFKNARVARRAKGQNIEGFVDRNMIGTPDEIVEKVQKLEKQGVTHILMANRANGAFGEMEEQTSMVGEEVIPALNRGVKIGESRGNAC